MLTVKGEKAEEDKAETTEFLYRGIAKRAFERRFQLADRGSHRRFAEERPVAHRSPAQHSRSHGSAPYLDYR